MSKQAAQKSAIITKYQHDPKDTGSTEVQIALLSMRISELTEHMKVHKKDLSSRHGLLKLVSQRRSLLAYLKNKSLARYTNLIKELGIRG